MEFKLPELGEGVHEGELIKWKVKPGDSVKYDQPLCEIMTDKATVEIPSAIQGKVLQMHAKEGDTVHVGQLMLSFEGSMAAAGAPAPAAAPAPSAPAVSAAPAAPAAVSAGAAEVSVATRVAAAPSTRRFARENGVELSQVEATGPHGRVMREDVERSLGGGAKAPSAARARTGIPAQQAEERVPFRGLRKKIAEKMRQSKDHAAHFTYVEEADATELVRLRNSAKEIGAAEGVKVTYLPFIMKAMVAALKKYPILNSSLDEEKNELVYKHYFNIGLSVQTDDGLTAPVVKDVQHKSVMELAKEIQDLVDRARNKKLTMEDLTGSTITLTNAGSIGGLFATPVINYPEVAILGFNKIFRKPVAVTRNKVETIEVRDWTYFSISLDHRVVDGAIGAEFMKLFIKYIENPALMVLEA
ncbi:MAG: dihydrolipoamide acetyltransferase family protein [Oligoflexia bacterium]|nr:dihydrolipoamide acetyltransferase family protein [Oligoflexia bacterium]